MPCVERSKACAGGGADEGVIVRRRGLCGLIVSQIQRLRKNGQTRQIFYFFENNFKTRKKSLPGAMIISNIQFLLFPVDRTIRVR
jgi:hypothetical protein